MLVITGVGRWWYGRGRQYGRAAVGVCARVGASVHTHAHLPAEADVVVVGGGVMGCFTLYQLARLGCRATLLERTRLTSGTTWHTNGLVWRVRPGDVDTAILNATRDWVLELERSMPAGWTTNGGLFIADNLTRLEEYSRLYTLGRSAGVECELLGPSEVKELYPIMEVGDVAGALYSPGDGTLDPSTLCTALTKQARLMGAQVFEDTEVTGVDVVEGQRGQPIIAGVSTSRGRISTSALVNCAGVWSDSLAKMAGVRSDLPLVAMKHSMVVMEAIPGVHKLPNVRDHDANMCLRVQGDSLIVGGYELNAARWEEVDPNFSFGLFDFDMDAFGEILEGAVRRVPRLAHTGIKATICGPEAFTPDRKPLLGEDGEVSGLFHGCGFNSSGMMLAGGCSEQLAHWVLHHRPTLHMAAYDCRRFAGAVKGLRAWAWERSHEAYTNNYSIVFPRDQPLAARTAITTPLFHMLTDAGCFWEEARGWERPGFFQDARTPLLDYDWQGAFGHPCHDHYPYRHTLRGAHTFGLPHYYNWVEREYLAMRDAAAVVDMSSQGKAVLGGRDVHAALHWLLVTEVPRVPGSITASLMLNDGGGVEEDFTVFTVDQNTRLSHESEASYLVTCGSGGGPVAWRKLRDICQRKGWKVDVRSATHDTAILAVLGPMSEEVMAAAGVVSTSKAHPYHHVSTMGGVQVRVAWRGRDKCEVHCAMADVTSVYQALMAAEPKPVNAGFYALNIHSLEKGFPSLHVDLRSTDTPLEAGLWRPRDVAADVMRPEGSGIRDFQGRNALLKQHKDGVLKTRVMLEITKCGSVWGGEAILVNGARVGQVRRADHSFALGCQLATGYVTHPHQPQQGDVWEVECMGRRFDASVRPMPPSQLF